MRTNKSSKTDKFRTPTWGDLIEAAEEIIRRNTLKNIQLKALVSHLRERQRSGERFPTSAE